MITQIIAAELLQYYTCITLFFYSFRILLLMFTLSNANKYKTTVIDHNFDLCHLEEYSGIECNGYPSIQGSIIFGPRAQKYSVPKILVKGGLKDPGSSGGEWLKSLDGRYYIIVPTKMKFR